MKGFVKKKGGLIESSLAKALAGFLMVIMLFMRIESVANVNNGRNRMKAVQISDHVFGCCLILFTCRNGIRLFNGRGKIIVSNGVIS
jgi:hypothetical protein